jgi:hypothetical protein
MLKGIRWVWHETIAPSVERGERVLIAAHGNSLRALAKYLDGVSEEDIVELDDDLKPLDRYYLGDPEKVKAAMEAVATQGRRSRRLPVDGSGSGGGLAAGAAHGANRRKYPDPALGCLGRAMLEFRTELFHNRKVKRTEAGVIPCDA